VTFFCTLAADYAWARYTAGIAGRDARRASLWSAVIILLSACTVVAYTTNRWMVVPAALGAYVGTFVAVRSEVTAS